MKHISVIGNDILTSFLLAFPKLLIIHSVLCFSNIMNDNNPMLMQAETQLSPVHRIQFIPWLVSLHPLKDLDMACHDMVYTFLEFKERGLVFQSPSSSSIGSSFSTCTSSNLFWCWRLNWAQLALLPALGSAISYLAPKTWIIQSTTATTLVDCLDILFFTAP